MKTLKALSLTALLLAGSMSFMQPTQASPVEPTQATTQATIEAPALPLSYPSTTITTTPAPVPTPTIEAPTQAPSETPTQAPLTGPTATPTQATTTPTYTGATAGPTPTTQAPTAPDTAGYPAQPPAPSDLATAGPTLPTAGATCYEDEPCWDCAHMGNRICGLSEAMNLTGYSPEQFNAQYVGLFPHTDNPAWKLFGNRYVQSVTNPDFDYVFQMTIAESCADPATSPTWIAEWCTAPTTAPEK